MSRLRAVKDEGGGFDLVRQSESSAFASWSGGSAAAAVRHLLLAGLLAALTLPFAAPQTASADPEFVIETAEEDKAVQWSSLPGNPFPEWGYKIAVSNESREHEGRRKQTWFEIPLSADPQKFEPAANLLNFVPKGVVYVGVGILEAQGMNPYQWSTNEVIVKPSGTKIVPPAPEPLSTTAEEESATWMALVGPKEWGYVALVSNLPAGSPGRATREVRLLRSNDPQIYTPNLTQLNLTPVEGKVYVEVGTVGIEGEDPGSYTKAVALKVQPSVVVKKVEPKIELPATLPPVNTTPPALSGTALAGQALATTNGNWTSAPVAYTYQWQLCSSAGTKCAAIPGVTSATLALSEAYVGSTLRSVVTASNAGGATVAASTPSAAVGAQVQTKIKWGVVRSTSWIAISLSQIEGVPPGSVVEVACHGHGCPFKLIRLKSGIRKTKIDLTHVFRGRHFAVGTTISIRVVKPGWVGRVYTLTARRGKRPVGANNCLAPGSTQPGRNC
jgi:hypothetical protein